jgi:hypothetical protein
MLSLIVYLTPFLLGLVVTIAFIAMISNFRRARKAPYFRIRQQATRRAWRWLLIVILGGAGIIAGINIRRALPPFDLQSLLPATASPAAPPALPSPGAGSPGTPLATRNLIDEPPTITPIPPTATVSPTPFISTIESDVTPPADATLSIMAISSGISANLDPVDEGTTFPVGTPRIYYWVAYENMENGLSWSRVLLLNGTVVRSESEAWERGTEGVAYYWFDAQGGWPTGAYEIQFYIGEQLADSTTYEVIN